MQHRTTLCGVAFILLSRAGCERQLRFFVYKKQKPPIRAVLVYLVELRGVEPLTCYMRSNRSTN